MSNEDLSRRSALGGGAAALLTGIGAALAVTAVGRDASAQNAGDVTALNGLLEAEYKAQQAYDLARGYFMMPAGDDPLRSLGPSAALFAARFRAQHTDHATRLVNLIRNFQGTPISESAVVFTPPPGFSRTVRNFLRAACNLEKAAAVAYVDALKRLSNTNAAELAAGVGGVATQRFTVIYLLLKGAVVPGTVMFSEANVNGTFSANVVSAEGAADGDTLRGIPPYMYM
jgi:hypothetical protein